MANISGDTYSPSLPEQSLRFPSDSYRDQTRTRLPRRLPPLKFCENHNLSDCKTKLLQPTESPVPSRKNKGHGDAKTLAELFQDKEDSILILESPKPRRKIDQSATSSRPSTARSRPSKHEDKLDLSETFPSPYNSRKDWNRQAPKNVYHVFADDEKYRYKVEKGLSDLERERLRIQALCRSHRFSSQEFQQNQQADTVDKKIFTVDERKRSKDKSAGEHFKWDFPPPKSSEDSPKYYMHDEGLRRSSESSWCSSPNVSSPLRKKNGRATLDHGQTPSKEHVRSPSEYAKPNSAHARSTSEHVKPVSEYLWLVSDSKPKSPRSSRGDFFEKVPQSPKTLTKDQKPKATEERLLSRPRIKTSMINSSREKAKESIPNDQLFSESKDDHLTFDVYEFLEYQNRHCFDEQPHSAPPKESKPKRCWFF